MEIIQLFILNIFLLNIFLSKNKIAEEQEILRIRVMKILLKKPLI